MPIYVMGLPTVSTDYTELMESTGSWEACAFFCPYEVILQPYTPTLYSAQ